MSEERLNAIGFQERRVGAVTILDTNSLLRIRLRFGRSSIDLANAVASLMASGQKDILLNLEGVSSISAKGLGDLVSTFVTIRNGGGQFKLFNLSPAVRQLMRATNLFAVFGLYENENQAVESFSAANSPSPAPDLLRSLPAGN